jgi:hypothetical protein
MRDRWTNIGTNPRGMQMKIALAVLLLVGLSATGHAADITPFHAKQSSRHDTGMSCGCGCCQSVPVNGVCKGYIPFLGWILSGTAQCTGDYPHDVAYCNAQCNRVFNPVICPPAQMYADCEYKPAGHGRTKPSAR